VYNPGGSCTTGTYKANPSGDAESLVPCTSDPDNPDMVPHSWSDPTKNISGKVYTFITFVKNDPGCDASCYGACSTKPEDCLKRIVVAVTVNGNSAPKRPIYVTGFTRDPRTSGNPLLTPGAQCTNDQGQPVKCTF
jgi:hypothetical protein